MGQVETSLRIWKVYEDTFDLTLTSVFRSDGENLKASFNHRRGRTFFASQGERVGPYAVVILTKTGKYSAGASLKDTRTSELHELLLNTPLKLPGLRAQIVDTDSLAIWDVRRNDEIPAQSLKVTAVTTEHVTASLPSGTVAIRPVSQEERIRLQEGWQQAERQREDAAEKARRVRQEKVARQLEAIAAAKAKAAAPRQTVSIQSAPKIFFGTEYRYPKSWAYYYTFEPGPAGVRAHPRVLAVPTEFETRMTGWSINVTHGD